MKRGRRLAVAVTGFAALAAVAGLASCEKMVPTGMGCSADSQCINPDFPVCSSGSCVARGSVDMAMPDLFGADLTFVPDDLAMPDLKPCLSASCPLVAPVCRGGVCAGCLTMPDCADHPGTPMCKGNGTCVQCLLPADCAAAQQTCDSSVNLCKPCANHGDCTSGICDVGACILEVNIAYVNGTTCPTSNADGTKLAPFCDIPDALPNLMARKYVSVAAGSYGRIDLNDKKVTIVGTGTKPWDLTFVTSKIDLAGNNPGVKVQGSNSDVTVDGFEIRAAKIGVQCSSSGRLTLRRSFVHDNATGTLGVLADSCSSLVLDANQIGPGNTGGGIKVANGTTYTIVNNFIVSNVSTVNPGVRFEDDASSGAFQFNTVANNTYTGNPGGIICPTTGVEKPIEMSIVFGNMPGTNLSQFSGDKCILRNVVTGTDPFAGASMTVPEFVLSPTDYRLKTGSGVNTCCIDQKTQGDGGALIAHDIEFDARPFNGKWDIGADETK